MKHFIYLLLIGMGVVAVSAFENNSKKSIKWVSIATLNTQYSQNPKPILIDLYTDWCGWCKHMDKTTYQDEQLVNYVNDKYYAIKFNAESKDSIVFNGITYKYLPGRKIHEFAVFLTFDRLEFPHTVFFSDIKGKPAALPGYMKPTEMEAPVKYFGERANKKQTFVAFNKQLKKEW